MLVPDGGVAGDALSRFCDQLQRQAPSLRVKTEHEALWPAPSLVLGRHGNIAFQAVPAGKTLAPFLEALAAAHAPPSLDARVSARLHEIDLPVPLKLYIAPGCPHCPRMLAQLLPLALEAGQIRLTVIDATLLAESAAADQIRAVPTLILDGQIRWTGQLDTDELITMCIRRDPAQMSSAAMGQLLEAGEAPRVARMMIAHGRIFSALIDLLVDERWSVRLGAMVSAEHLSADAPELADELIQPLWNRLAELPEEVQGDVVHVLGLLAPLRVEGRLQDVLSGAFPDSVKEAAAEALAAMETRARDSDPRPG